jgi:hypothetical protein
MRAWLAAAGLVSSALATPHRLTAQLCRPSASSNEAKTFAILSVPLAFGPLTAPEPHPRFEVGLEGTYLPKVGAATATPTTCQPGKGSENTAFLFAVPRPRVGLPLPLGLALQASWIPPLRVGGVKANLFGVSLARSFELGSLVASLRAHGTFGSIHAAITCADDDLGDPTSECFGGTRSDDRFSPNIAGTDLSLGWTMLDGRLRPYVGGGYNRLQPRFRVNFTNRFGYVDRTRVAVDLDRAVFFGGATLQLANRLAASAEVYSSPTDATTVRLALRALRR